ncbi:MAG: ATP-binding protein [Methanotrichaceae archaeon]|nr:ATP-binding protein [Methanotrichaceae archaeon]
MTLKDSSLIEKKENQKGLDGLLQTKIIETKDTTYRIIAKNVSEYHFTVPFEVHDSERVEVGQIFSIKDKGLTFLARVIDIRHDSNYDGNWDTTFTGTQFFDQSQIFNRVIAEPLGCILEGKFKKCKTLPTKFSLVKRAEEYEFSFLQEVMGDIEIGYLRNGSMAVEQIPVSIHSTAIDHHIGIFATTGMGKSNFMKVFAASCMQLAARNESKFGLLIVDPHGEYLKGKGPVKGLMHLKRYSEGLVCYSIDRKNFSDPGVAELSISISEIEAGDLSVLYDWSAAQRDALEAIARVFESCWLERIQKPDGINKMVSEGFNATTMGVISRRIKNLLEKNRYIDPVRSSLPGIISNLQDGRVVLIDIPRMSEQSELFLLSILSRYILEKYKEESSVEQKNCLITIEEAQRVLGTGSNTYRFETIAREGRKFGVGLCAITQQPKLIDKQLLSQINTFVVMGLADRNDRVHLEESARHDLSSLDIEIQTLEKGEAIVSTLGIPFPVPAKIHSYEVYLKKLEKEGRTDERLVSGGRFKPIFD